MKLATHTIAHLPLPPMYQIPLTGFTNVWLQDESHNPTGTHKDRMAEKIVLHYNHFLEQQRAGIIQELPQLSIITSGTAGFAIQTLLRKHHLPALKCLVDAALDATIKKHLTSIGCELFETNLSKKPLSRKDILALTNNPNGIDITSFHPTDSETRYYDQLAQTIIEHRPEYCFIPFGTGQLYENVLDILKIEILRLMAADTSSTQTVDHLRSCHLFGATTDDPTSPATKLYSPHLPFSQIKDEKIRSHRTDGFCGSRSDVHAIDEHYLQEALNVAAAVGIECEPSGIAGLALLIQMQTTIPRDAKIVIVNTGKTKYEFNSGTV